MINAIKRLVLYLIGITEMKPRIYHTILIMPLDIVINRYSRKEVNPLARRSTTV